MFLSDFIFYAGVLGHKRLPLGGILLLWETLEWLENVTRASIDIRASIK